MASSTDDKIIKSLNALIKGGKQVQSSFTQLRSEEERLLAQYNEAKVRREEAEAAKIADLETIQYRRRELGKRIGQEHDTEPQELDDLLKPYALQMHSFTRIPGPAPTLTDDRMSVDGLDFTQEPPPARTATAHKPTNNIKDPSTWQLKNARPYDYLPWASTVVLAKDGTWIELRCGDCGGNHSMSTGEYFRGPNAFGGHLSKSHELRQFSFDQTIEHCTHRVLTSEEVQNICELKEVGQNQSRGDDGYGIRDAAQSEASVSSKNWNWSKDRHNFLPHLPCVVKHPDGHWVELACPLCGGNTGIGSTSAKSGFLKGAKAFYDHLAQAHGEQRPIGGPATTIDRCMKPEFTDDDIDLLKRRDRDAPVVTAVPVQHFDSPDARPRNESGKDEKLRAEVEFLRKRAGEEETGGRGKRNRTTHPFREVCDEDDEERMSVTKERDGVKTEQVDLTKD